MIEARVMALAALASAALFLAFPELDRMASAALFQPDRGFLLENHAFFDRLHRNIGLLAWLIALATLAVMAGAARLPRLARWRRPAAYLLAAYLLGPGLLVNSLFKEHWGRARPVQTTEFGGSATFTPAWVISDQCDRNCAFVCGDASIGFGLAAIAFVSTRPRRWLVAGLVAGTLLGLMRMAQGGHYLSDVVFSFFAVWFTAWALARTMTLLGRPPGPPP